MIRGIVLISISFWLLGCSTTSPQIQHLQLSAGDAPVPGGRTPVVVLESIDVPDYLLRDELLHRDSQFALRYNATRRWAEPLDLGIQRVLGRRLQTSLGTQRLILYPDVPSSAAHWRLRVTITHFEVSGSNATIAALGRWEPQQPELSIVESVVFESSQALTGNSGEDIARVMSQLLWEFADKLTAALAQQPAPPQGQTRKMHTSKTETTPPKRL